MRAKPRQSWPMRVLHSDLYLPWGLVRGEGSRPDSSRRRSRELQQISRPRPRSLWSPPWWSEHQHIIDHQSNNLFSSQHIINHNQPIEAPSTLIVKIYVWVTIPTDGCHGLSAKRRRREHGGWDRDRSQTLGLTLLVGWRRSSHHRDLMLINNWSGRQSGLWCNVSWINDNNTVTSNQSDHVILLTIVNIANFI